MITTLKIILAIKTILFIIKKNPLRIKPIDIILMCTFLVYAIYSIFLEHRFTGMSMFVDTIFALAYAATVREGLCERGTSLWDKVLYAIFLSALACIIVGIFEYNFADDYKTVYLSGVYYKRFSGVVGVDRFCMLACIALIFPLFYVKNRAIKFSSIIIINACMLCTISLTALACMGTFFVAYSVINYNKLNKRFVAKIGLVLLSYSIYVWLNGSSINVINSIVMRINRSIQAVFSGDLARATTGRTVLADNYIQVFIDSNIFGKMFGTGIINQYALGNYLKYSHNTYIDLLLYMGLFGLIILTIKLIVSIKYIQDSEIKQRVFLMKLVTIITGISVSAMTADYWLVFLMM